MKIWILLANSTQASFYSVSEKNHNLNLLKQLKHSESKLHNHDLVSDANGRFNKGHFESPDPKTAEVNHFTQEICHELESARTRNECTDLIVIADPHFYGALFKNANPKIQKLIKYHHPQDYTHYSETNLIPELEKLLAHEIRLIETS